MNYSLFVDKENNKDQLICVEMEYPTGDVRYCINPDTQQYFTNLAEESFLLAVPKEKVPAEIREYFRDLGYETAEDHFD